MSRPAAVRIVFIICLAIAAVALARLGSTTLALEREQASLRKRALLEENLQLALWRMDSALAPMMAEESARPYFMYNAFYPADRAYTRMFGEINRGEVLIPSPLLTLRSPRILLHFQYSADGKLTSPEAPTGNMRDLAEARYVAPERIDRSTKLLAEVGVRISKERLDKALSTVEISAPPIFEAKDSETVALQRGASEYTVRSRNMKRAQSAPPDQALVRTERGGVTQSPLEAFWIGDALLLARRVRVGNESFIQGAWLDWREIQGEFRDAAADLVSQPKLLPDSSLNNSSLIHRLAALPVRLDYGPIDETPETGWTPARISLAIAWGCLALAAVASAVLLHGALALSRRRGAFVSAVTHELRTPLTTFRLYSEMLDEDMVADPVTRDSYLKTLRSEAERLARLVENVLSFAKLERGRATLGRETVALDELVDRLAPRLALLAGRAGRDLVVERRKLVGAVYVNVSVVEQVLSNLVDNSIKYASCATDPRLHFEVSVEGRRAVLVLRDHGSGLDKRAVHRLFRPFSKSAQDAVGTAPGVGLGLALSRRLARAMGGDLKLAANGPAGAAFALLLPIEAPVDATG